MWLLYRLAYKEKQDGNVLRRELDLLYPGLEIPLVDSASYLVVGYFLNQLSEFRKYVESIKSKNG